MYYLLLLLFGLLFSSCTLQNSVSQSPVLPSPTAQVDPTATPLSDEQKELATLTTIPTPTSVTSTCEQDVIICPNSTIISREGKDCHFSVCPVSAISSMAVYRNPTLGFEISFPPSFKAVTDRYGWPKEVVLLYQGGQSYDLVIEQWKTQAEIDTKYPSPQNNLTTKKVGNVLITFFNMNNLPKVDEVISSYRVID